MTATDARLLGHTQARGSHHTDEVDVIVIGSGCAGAAVARVVAEAGLTCFVVEEGPWMPPEARRSDTWSSFRSVWREAGFQVARGRIMLPILQGRAVGGSTVINGAIVHRLPEAIHRNWGEVAGIGSEMTYATLTRIFDQLDRELHVAPGPAAILGNNNLLMQKAAEASGIRSNVILRNVVGCDAFARCLQGCPNGRKQSMDLTFLPFAQQRGTRIYSSARVDRITQHAGRAKGVAGTFLDLTGKPAGTFALHARKAVVVAASAIQTPQLLAASGIGRQSGLVGRRFQAHPGSSIMGVFDEPVRMWFGATQGYETTHYWDEKMKFETVGMPPEVGVARLPGYGPALMQRAADFGHVAQWGVQVRSEAHGRVRRGLFGGASITYDMTNNDIRTLKLGLKRVSHMMFAAGARKIYPGIHGLPDELTDPKGMDALDHLPDDPRLFHGIASHLFGTATMGTDPRRSVVKESGESHELPGLYVADSSVFPTNMGVNPAHTISAVAWYMAERIVA
jgi:choline dehydrogenase-like flavoprotein